MKAKDKLRAFETGDYRNTKLHCELTMGDVLELLGILETRCDSCPVHPAINGLRRRFEDLVEALWRHPEHEDECPMDDNCKCPDILALNERVAAFEKMLEPDPNAR